jgi:hypothetical protein
LLLFFAVLIVIGVVEEKEKRESTYISALEFLNVFIMANISAENAIFISYLHEMRSTEFFAQAMKSSN